jgi:hydrophobic/amphiphilic exporter-1 (mainly G- bacteria), HAE1 family
MIRWAVHRPAVVWATAASLLLAGGVSFSRLALATKTTVELPELSVSISWGGATAELVEMYLASPIEAAIQGVRGVRKTSSQSNDGTTSLRVTLEPNADVQLARLAILERLELLRPEFPAGTTPARVSNYVPDALDEAPLLYFTLAGPYTPGALQKIANEQISPRLSAVPGVAGVGAPSNVELGVAVGYDPLLLRQLDVSPQLLADALRDSRLVQAVGEERFGSAQREVVLRDQPNAIEELGNLPIRSRTGRVFRLGELASIRRDEDTRGSFLRINGEPAIALTVTRLPGADAIKTAATSRRTLDELLPALPPGLKIKVVSDDSEQLKRELKDLLTRGAIAFAAVTLVLLLTLANVRAVLLVMGSAGIAVAGTALGLYLFDIPANLLTLAGLGMGVGILVQDGLIVVNRLGSAPDTPDGRASAASRIFPAVLGATLTTIVVLFPFLYLQGNARAAFMPFAAAFALALGWSIVAAVVMVPALGSTHGFRVRRWPRAGRLYRRILVYLLRWRWVTIGATAVGLGVLSWGFVKRVPRFSWGGFGQQRSVLRVSLSFPRGSDPESVDREMRQFENIVVGQEGVEQVVSQGSVSSGRMSVLFTPDGALSAMPISLQDELTQRAVFVGGASINVMGQGPAFYNAGGSSSISSYRIRVLGFSFAGVEAVARDLKERLEQIPRVRDVNINAGNSWGQERAYAVTLEPDRLALARFGLTAQQFATAVAREVNGPVGQQRIDVAGEEVPVSVKAKGARERSLDELKEALLPTTNGAARAPVRIGDVARVSERNALSSISREDQQYVRLVSYDFRGPSKLAQRTHEAFMKSISVPPGYTVGDASMSWGGEDDSDKGLWLVFALGVVLVILTVAMVFDSAWAAWMVLLSLPVAVGGVMAAFWMAKATFTREAAVGVILVVGLAVHQAILLVDAAVQARRKNARNAARRTLHAAQALRAAADRSGMIMLVTLSTLASLVPLAVGTDPNDLFGAIALATVGGTIAGTLGAMLVLPALIVGRRARAR